MNTILIGYFPKKTAKRPEWLEVPHVEEVCSVSDCISSGPDGWIDHWTHNAFWAYDSPDAAWSVVPANQADFDLYAWRIFPVRFTDEHDEPLELPHLDVAPLPPTFIRLGFDAVSRHLDSTFECSPLSCNSMAQEIPVNRFCLVETESEAFRVAREFARTEPEPGPYFLIEVWRDYPNANVA